MRKIVFKTIFITLGIVLILAISAFGILSFAAPKAMMNFSASLGLDAISGDYAYQEYRRSGDIDYLAYAFEVAANEGRPAAAAELAKIFIDFFNIIWTFIANADTLKIIINANNRSVTAWSDKRSCGGSPR